MGRRKKRKGRGGEKEIEEAEPVATTLKRKEVSKAIIYIRWKKLHTILEQHKSSTEKVLPIFCRKKNKLADD